MDSKMGGKKKKEGIRFLDYDSNVQLESLRCWVKRINDRGGLVIEMFV